MVTLLHPISFQNIGGQRNVTVAQEASTQPDRGCKPCSSWVNSLFSTQDWAGGIVAKHRYSNNSSRPGAAASRQGYMPASRFSGSRCSMVRVSRRSTNHLPRLFHQQTMDADPRQSSSRSEKKQHFLCNFVTDFFINSRDDLPGYR